MKILRITMVAALLAAASVATAQTTPTLSVSVSSPTSVAAGNNARIASITLTANDGAATLSQLPLSVGLSDPMMLSGCGLSDQSGTSLTTQHPFSLSSSGQVMAQFDTPLSVNGTETLSLMCTVETSAPNGSTIAVSIFPSLVVASSTSGTVVATSPATVDGATTDSVVAVSSPTGQVATGGSSTPGVPNTGAGGDAPAVWATLIISGLVVLSSGTYLARKAS